MIMDYIEELCDKIGQLQTSNPRATLWFSGDVNLPDIDWETHTIKGHNYPISINQCFLNSIYDTGSDQIVRFPTRGESILDVFLTNHPYLIEKCKTVPGVSDHDIVFVEASTRATRTKNLPIEACGHRWKETGCAWLFYKIHYTVFSFHWCKRTVGYTEGLHSWLFLRQGPQQDDIITL